MFNNNHNNIDKRIVCTYNKLNKFYLNYIIILLFFIYIHIHILSACGINSFRDYTRIMRREQIYLLY